MFAGLSKKKKSKSSRVKDGAAKEKADEAPTADGEFNPTHKKKKKKAAVDNDDFEAKLASAGVNENEEAEEAEVEQQTEEGDLELGTGIWAHNSTAPLGYPQLLSRFFTLLHNHHPDLMSSATRSYKVLCEFVKRKQISYMLTYR